MISDETSKDLNQNYFNQIMIFVFKYIQTILVIILDNETSYFHKG